MFYATEIRVFRLSSFLLPKEMKKACKELLDGAKLGQFQHVILDFSQVKSITTESMMEMQALLKALRLLGKNVYFAGIPSSLAPALVPFLRNYPLNMFYRTVSEALDALSVDSKPASNFSGSKDAAR